MDELSKLSTLLDDLEVRKLIFGLAHVRSVVPSAGLVRPNCTLVKIAAASSRSSALFVTGRRYPVDHARRPGYRRPYPPQLPHVARGPTRTGFQWPAGFLGDGCMADVASTRCRIRWS